MTLPSVSPSAISKSAIPKAFEFKSFANKSHFSKTLLASALALSFMGAGLSSAQAATSAMPDAAKLAAGEEQKVIDWRRDLHQHPELSNREFRTSKIIEKHLKSLGLEVQTGVAHTGVVAILKGGKSGPLIAIRADMDALPVTEVVDVPFASKATDTYRDQKVGVMHACGHDTHVAMLMGVAENLVKVKDSLAGDVMFIFQPAEEGAPDGEEGGAELMLKEGLFAKRKPDQVFGMHVTSSMPSGMIGVRSGPAMASEDSFTIKVKGRQTHGSRPWNGVDPIVAAAQIITNVQTIVSRQVDITKAPAVVSFGAVNGGIRSNIIPDEVELIGTIRTFDQPMRADIKLRLAEMAELSAKTLGASATTAIHPGYPVVVNNPELVASMRPVLASVVGDKMLIEPGLITGAEDFSYYALEAPGMFFFLGVTPKGTDPETAASNHSPAFYVDESALKVGVEAMTKVALTALNAQ
ncbi:amidohydrolase [Shewanella baltica]|uniref:amidohydrolase n=1 Tax=Shewanella baltica TaxID=62322 RepID=UPI00217EA4B0|nr:amidohydrolase [Shewanella baltica]MCS6128355.1 amidohydrolase [Shewanella baltica]MCS6140210.1 amidohydrolase [Shewanella baltica]MCS6146569.1 amidohydrolase [Shewanella baltica]MCS6171099.1 amidohydrolase [Shewanella baltica]MCS6188247.1 amidohydrolase [Shewanella baltica]